MKTIYAVTTLLILSLLLAACGGRANPTKTPTSAPMETSTEEMMTESPSETVEATETMAGTDTPEETSGTPVATRTAGATVTIEVAESAELGSYLVDDQGMTLYIFKEDSPNTSTCYEEDDCAEEWPPLLITGTGATAGTGVDASKLGTTRRTDGGIQVTYFGWPLYYFDEDLQPGDVEGQGEDDFFVISPEGEVISQ